MLHDKDIREPLFEFLEETYGKTRIIEEKVMGKSRADVVMVTEDSIFGIEIKSDADTYTRLSGQVKDYDRFFDFNYVVVGTSHALHVDEHVPEYWGIITVEDMDSSADFYILRRPQPNPKVTWKNKLSILWRPELAMIQIWNEMPKYNDKSKLFVVDKILERLEKGKISEETLKKQMSDLLFERDYNNISAVLKEYKESEKARIKARENNPAELDKLLEQRARAKENFQRKRRRRKRR